MKHKTKIQMETIRIKVVNIESYSQELPKEEKENNFDFIMRINTQIMLKVL